MLDFILHEISRSELFITIAVVVFAVVIIVQGSKKI